MSMVAEESKWNKARESFRQVSKFERMRELECILPWYSKVWLQMSPLTCIYRPPNRPRGLKRSTKDLSRRYKSVYPYTIDFRTIWTFHDTSNRHCSLPNCHGSFWMCLDASWMGVRALGLTRSFVHVGPPSWMFPSLLDTFEQCMSEKF